MNMSHVRSQLYGASAVVGRARPVHRLHVAVAGGYEGGLPEEGGELAPACILVADGAEAAELARVRGLHERVVCVEGAALAAALAAVAQHATERAPRDDRRHAAGGGQSEHPHHVAMSP